MSTQRVACEQSLRGVLSSLSSPHRPPHHRIPSPGRACSQATQQALVRYSQKNTNQWQRRKNFEIGRLHFDITSNVQKIIICPHFCSAICFQTPFRSRCLIPWLFSLKRSDCYVWRATFLCITFIFSLKWFPRFFLSPFTVSEKSVAAVRNAYGVILQIIAVGNKGREIA